MYCPSCGFKLDENQNFCPQCGHSFENWGDISPSTRKVYGKNKSWFYIIFILCFGLTIWGFYALANAGNKLEIITKSQLEEIQKNQITKAYYEHTSSQYKKNMSLEDFKKFINKNPALKEHGKIKFQASQQENNYGVVFADLYLFDDIKVPTKFEFIKEDGDWKILKFDVDQPQIVLNDKMNSQNNDALTITIKEQLDTIKENNLSKAYLDFSSDEFKASTKPELFNEFIHFHPQFQNFEEISLTHVDKTLDKAKVNLILYANKIPLPLEYSLIKKDGKWQIWSIQVVDIQKGQPHYADGVKEYLANPIKSFVNTLSKDDLQRAYEQTAPSFRKTTNFETFKNFIQRFPIIKNDELKFENTLEDKNLSLVRVKVDDPKDFDTIEFTLSKEDEAWKILGIEMIQNQLAKPKAEVPSDFDDTFLREVIEDQLKLIQANRLEEAYEKYTSNEFKKITSLAEFISFIKGNTIYAANKSGKFTDLMLDNNMATIKGILFSKTGEHGYVEYDLIKEDNEWKILGIRILAAEEGQEESSPPPPKELV